MYNQKVVDYFMNPRNAGRIEDADAIGEVGNPKCGDVMKIYLKINPQSEVIEDIKFETFGCAARGHRGYQVRDLRLRRRDSDQLDGDGAREGAHAARRTQDYE